ncbi:MAG TPA: biosynthetic arginine decarboxylase [Longimicrobiales bacterium]|nr:biosynthetic arginine decarboxylase [Longimicrobiales bacterium]
MRSDQLNLWTPEDSAKIYRVEEWGGGYFGVTPRGTVAVYPDADPKRAIDLFDVACGLSARDLTPPIIVRFPGILGHRMRHIRRAFDDAIAELKYKGTYCCLYPIKVNQERHVCEAIRTFANELGFGLEVGSKPELLAGLALTKGMNGMPLVCNGFKDAEYVEIVTLAAKMGRNILPVVEQAHELQLIEKSAAAHNVVPRFGIRAKLAAAGVGRWAGSSGYRGKFGLTVGEILHAVDQLRASDMLSGFKLLHCHMGSQIFDIRAVKAMVSEMAHLYVELRRAGAPVEILDIGGGLGVDYDGTGSASGSSVNYTLEQYAADVLYRIQSICDEAGVPVPNLMSESGRALVAHSSVLICEVIGSRVFPTKPDAKLVEGALAQEQPPQPLLDAHDAYQRRGEEDLLEAYADAEHALAEATTLFSLGYMDLQARAACEELFWAMGRAVLDEYGSELPEGLDHLHDQLADLYFLNLSVFQSLLDTWGIEQLFPVMPIHRLAEEPTRRGVLADITCDSDGRVDRFPGEWGPKTTLELHAPEDGAEPGVGKDKPYYLAFFLTGAYQETLGDLHNLLGDTHAVHVSLGADGRWKLDQVVEGDTVREVLGYVQFDADEIRQLLRQDIEAGLESERLTLAEGASFRRFLDDSLVGYTYLE